MIFLQTTVVTMPRTCHTETAPFSISPLSQKANLKGILRDACLVISIDTSETSKCTQTAKTRVGYCGGALRQGLSRGKNAKPRKTVLSEGKLDTKSHLALGNATSDARAVAGWPVSHPWALAAAREDAWEDGPRKGAAVFRSYYY